MKTTFYYFTGTGNSLYGAEKIAKNFDETEIIPIARVLKSKEEIKFPKGVSGIVCPVYLAGIPLIVSEFIKNVMRPLVTHLNHENLCIFCPQKKQVSDPNCRFTY